VKKTTLTISGAGAYADALLKDARISGRTVLALRAEPDQRRSGSQATIQTGIQQPDRKNARAGKHQGDRKSVQAGMEPGQVQPGPDAEAPAGPGHVAGDQAPELQDEESDQVSEQTISWNPGSFASTKAALIEAETSLGGTVDEAIVFIDPAGGGKRLPDLSLGQIEASTTIWITGYTQLIRELARRFAEQGSGLILVVLLPGERGPLGSMASGAMEALACSLAAQTGENYRVLALHDESGQAELLARYIMKILDEPPRDSSKLLRHGGRINLFGK